MWSGQYTILIVFPGRPHYLGPISCSNLKTFLPIFKHLESNSCLLVNWPALYLFDLVDERDSSVRNERILSFFHFSVFQRLSVFGVKHSLEQRIRMTHTNTHEQVLVVNHGSQNTWVRAIPSVKTGLRCERCWKESYGRVRQECVVRSHASDVHPDRTRHGFHIRCVECLCLVRSSVKLQNITHIATLTLRSHTQTSHSKYCSRANITGTLETTTVRSWNE